MIYFTIDQVTPAITPKDQVTTLCKMSGEDLSAKFVSNKAGFLMALAGVESNYGFYNVPRYEPAYGPQGLYLKRSSTLQKKYDLYGALACCSYGPWQILYSTALDQRFNDHPLLLHSGGVSIAYVVSYLNSLVPQGADTIEKLAAAYNAGPMVLKSDKFWPKKYVNEFLDKYSIASKL